VLADASGRHQPTEWARTAIAAYRAHHADRVVAEVNNCGEMVEAALRVIDPNVAFAAVRASRDKVTRAEPVAALYEQGGFIISAPSRSSKIRCPALCPLVTAMSPCARRDTRPTASTPWCGR
jgi:phage terminase large subunit-like protein